MPVPTTYAAAVYVHGTIIPPAWFNFNNVWLARAIEGTAGCGVGEAYTPSDPIRINGAGIETETYLTATSAAVSRLKGDTAIQVTAGATLAPAGGTVSLTVNKNIYFINATGGGTIEMSNPPADWPVNTYVRFVVNTAGASVTIKSGASIDVVFVGTGGLTGWAEVYWNGTQWTTVGWGGGATYNS